MASERQPRWKRRAYNIAALREEARRVLPRPVFDFVDGGAGDEHTLRRNVSAFDSVALYPRPIGGTASRDLSTTLFGRRLSMPLIVPPTGLAGLLWPEGEAASARAATKAGSVYCLSHGSICTLEELAETGVEPRWFQTYIYTDRGLTHEMAERAAAAGYEALIVTIDTQIIGNRERDIRNGFVIPPRFSAGEIANMAFKLRWLFRMRRTIPKITFGNYRRPGDANDLTTLHERMLTLPDQGMQWDDIAALRAVWKGPLLLKGVLHPADAAEAVANGVDGVFVSNHGGRQLDGVASAFDALPRVADAVAGRAAVLLDGGIRRGTHIVKALALGADCCTIGRAQFWGLTVAGEAGVAHVFDIFRRELDLTMGLCGLADIASIGPDVLARPGKAARESAMQAAALCQETAPTTPPRTAPKSVSNPLPRRAARRDRNPPATAIGSARDAPSTSDRTGAATSNGLCWADQPSGSARKARISPSAPSSMRPLPSATASSVSRSQMVVSVSPASSSACRADALARENSTLTPSTSAPSARSACAKARILPAVEIRSSIRWMRSPATLPPSIRPAVPCALASART